MKTYTPLVHLARKITEGQPDEYFIHVVTFMNNTNYKADGYNTIPSLPTNNRYVITVKIKTDPLIPNMTLLTPVVHSLSLGTINLSSTPLIEIDVLDQNSALVGKKIIHRDDADEAAMPIDLTRQSYQLA